MNPLAQLMSFVRRKLVKGIPYLYEVESYRDPQTGKVKQRTLRYLGRDPQHPKPKKLGTTTKLLGVGDPCGISVGARIRLKSGQEFIGKGANRFLIGIVSRINQMGYTVSDEAYALFDEVERDG